VPGGEWLDKGKSPGGKAGKSKFTINPAAHTIPLRLSAISGAEMSQFKKRDHISDFSQVY
jgi:hypothetical protein